MLFTLERTTAAKEFSTKQVRGAECRTATSIGTRVCLLLSLTLTHFRKQRNSGFRTPLLDERARSRATAKRGVERRENETVLSKHCEARGRKERETRL